MGGGAVVGRDAGGVRDSGRAARDIGVRDGERGRSSADKRRKKQKKGSNSEENLVDVRLETTPGGCQRVRSRAERRREARECRDETRITAFGRPPDPLDPSAVWNS